MIPSDERLNPFNVDPQLDLPHALQDAPNWAEYHYLFAYDPDQNVAMSIHIGRLVEDLGLWRGILYVFPPEGDVLIHRCVGRAGPQDRGPSAGPFKASCLDPLRLWMLEFDGAMHRSNPTDLAHGVDRDGIDEPVKFRVLLEAASPLYTNKKQHAEGQATWAHHHHEQFHTMRGEFTHKGRTLALQGMGVRDHSSGPRDYTQMLGAYWVQLFFPKSGRVVHACQVSRQGNDMTKLYVSNSRTGYIWWNDDAPLEMIELRDGPFVPDETTPLASLPRDTVADPAQRKFTLTMGSSRGDQTVEVERVRFTATTYIPPAEEIAGTDLSRQDSLRQGKHILRATWNGEVGYGMTDDLVAIKFLQRN